MAGFFKKLFNRITGKPAEDVAVVEEVQAALPAPEPEPEIIVPKVKAKKLEPKKVAAEKVKIRHRDQKNIGKRRAPTNQPPTDSQEQKE